MQAVAVATASSFIAASMQSFPEQRRQRQQRYELWKGWNCEAGFGGNKLETTTKYGDKSSLAEMCAAVYLISALLSITPVFLPPPVHSWSFLAGWKNGFLSVIWPWNSLLSLSRRRRRTATASTSHACASGARSVSMGSNGRGSVWCVGLPGTVHHCAVLFACLYAAE